MGIHERKEREKEHRKEEILDAAQKVFFEKGLFVSTMEEIAEAAELSKGTLYLYYKSKEDLYLAVMMRGTQKLSELFHKVINAQASTLGKILGISESYMEFFKTYPNYFRMMYFAQLPHFHRQVSTEVREQCNLEQEKLWNPVVDLFQRAIEEKTIRSDLNPMELAIILWSSATALMLRIDSESQVWMERHHIDIKNTLRLSNTLLWNSMLTEKGQTEYQGYIQ
jgi:AcrR family transcriptional regulator